MTNRIIRSIVLTISISAFAVPGAVWAIPVPQQTAPDNTRANKGDQYGSTPTADTTGKNSSDRDLARKIRRDVVRDKSLSTDGHNVKIIVQSGKVTLKGPVHTDAEKQTIAGLAQKYAGDGNVVDQITVMNGSK